MLFDVKRGHEETRGGIPTRTIRESENIRMVTRHGDSRYKTTAPVVSFPLRRSTRQRQLTGRRWLRSFPNASVLI